MLVHLVAALLQATSPDHPQAPAPPPPAPQRDSTTGFHRDKKPPKRIAVTSEHLATAFRDATARSILQLAREARTRQDLRRAAGDGEGLAFPARHDHGGGGMHGNRLGCPARGRGGGGRNLSEGGHRQKQQNGVGDQFHGALHGKDGNLTTEADGEKAPAGAKGNNQGARTNSPMVRATPMIMSSSCAICTGCPPHSATGVVACNSIENHIDGMTRASPRPTTPSW